MTPEQKALAVLKKLGIKSVQFLRRTTYDGLPRLRYIHRNGQPVQDAPIFLVDGDDIQVRPWTDQLK